jgi:hypothetical protein
MSVDRSFDGERPEKTEVRHVEQRQHPDEPIDPTAEIEPPGPGGERGRAATGEPLYLAGNLEGPTQPRMKDFGITDGDESTLVGPYAPDRPTDEVSGKSSGSSDTSGVAAADGEADIGQADASAPANVAVTTAESAAEDTADQHQARSDRGADMRLADRDGKDGENRDAGDGEDETTDANPVLSDPFDDGSEERDPVNEAGREGADAFGEGKPDGLIDVAVDDPAASALAERLNGWPSVRFDWDATEREFDAVSDLFVAQSKPADFQIGSTFRNQAKATFEAALKTGRTPYFHFEGPPRPQVIEKLAEYESRYGIKSVVDTKPLG